MIGFPSSLAGLRSTLCAGHVMDNKNDIREHERASKAKDSSGQYASNSLPTLRKQLQTAESLQSEHGVSSR
jgi:hypothetical protein